jgi:hypothetical protein
MTAKIPLPTTEYIIRPDNIRINTMINKLLGHIKTLLKAKFAVTARIFAPADEIIPDEKQILVAADGNVLDMGKRYRLTSGHAPLFSLYTFFKNSQ